MSVIDVRWFPVRDGEELDVRAVRKLADQNTVKKFLGL